MALERWMISAQETTDMPIRVIMTSFTNRLACQNRPINEISACT
jgi:hypothetical protein